MQQARNSQCERFNFGVESFAVVGEHLVAPFHRAHGGIQYGTARVLKFLAGFKVRLLPDDAVATDLLHVAVGVGNEPMPGQEFRRDLADI